MPDADKVESLDSQLKSLRSDISDLAYQVDSYKTKTASALGAGVFLLFLAAGAAYDLIARKGGVWLNLGLTRETLVWIASGLGASATILLILGFRRVRLADNGVKAKLDLMERQYAEFSSAGTPARGVDLNERLPLGSFSGTDIHFSSA